MVSRLDLPFPYLSDPDRSGVIGPLGLRNERDPRDIAIPAVVLIDESGQEAWRWVARDYADRIDETAVIAAAGELGLPPVTAEPVPVGPAQAGSKAVDLDTLDVYFRGARFAVSALRSRHEAISEDATAFIDQMDRYRAALRHRRGGAE